MKYNTYHVITTQHGPVVSVQEAKAVEIECQCGVAWLFETVKQSAFICHYCGAGADGALDNEYLAISEQSATAQSYGRDLRGIARVFWRGAVDFDQAYGLLLDTIRIGLTRAWYEGAQACDITPGDLSPEERAELTGAIALEQSHIIGLLDFIQKHSKKNKGKFATVRARVALWELRYIDIVNRAKLMACADQKLEWVRGPTSDGCSTCISMSGKVKRASYWAARGPHPQDPPNETIKCGGWNCLCELLVTDKPLSRGPLPKWP
jgi:hypothetical protein